MTKKPTLAVCGSEPTEPREVSYETFEAMASAVSLSRGVDETYFQRHGSAKHHARFAGGDEYWPLRFLNRGEYDAVDVPRALVLVLARRTAGGHIARFMWPLPPLCGEGGAAIANSIAGGVSETVFERFWSLAARNTDAEADTFHPRHIWGR